jgi:predicted DsbA family dithiol-disulfide isomerase
LNGGAVERVRHDIGEARAASVAATPTFLFGTVESDGRLKVVRHESGAMPAKAFAEILEELLRGSTASRP